MSEFIPSAPVLEVEPFNDIEILSNIQHIPIYLRNNNNNNLSQICNKIIYILFTLSISFIIYEHYEVIGKFIIKIKDIV